jgi:hypothetical protein
MKKIMITRTVIPGSEPSRLLGVAHQVLLIHSGLGIYSVSRAITHLGFPHHASVLRAVCEDPGLSSKEVRGEAARPKKSPASKPEGCMWKCGPEPGPGCVLCVSKCFSFLLD